MVTICNDCGYDPLDDGELPTRTMARCENCGFLVCDDCLTDTVAALGPWSRSELDEMAPDAEDLISCLRGSESSLQLCPACIARGVE
jgi:hypothetical protein